MPRIPITDLDDPRIAVYRSIKATNATRRLDQFVVEGEKLVERLIASRFPPASVLATDRRAPRLEVSIPDDVPLYIVPSGLIHELVGYSFHRGVMAAGTRLPAPAVDEVLRGAAPRARLAVCPRLSNPDNLGAIIRISDVFGLDAVLAGPSCPDPFSRRVLRVSMGSALRVPVIVADDPGAAVDRLAADWGVELLAAVADADAEPFDAFPVPPRWGLILGNEDEGVDAEWIARSRRSITIPMAGAAGSLNVAVAAGILLYRLSRS